MTGQGPGLSLVLLVSLLTSHTSLVRGILTRSGAGHHQVSLEEVATRLAESEKDVSLALVINNMSGHKLSLEEVDLSCGVFSNNSSMPDTILPDTTAVVFIEKGSGLTGVCGAASYSVDGLPGVSVMGMFSQPYNLNIHSSFTAAGLRKDKPSYRQGLFYAMYYGTGQWVRSQAGQEAVYQLEELEVMTNMTEDSYRPLVFWTIQQFEVEQAKVSLISAGSGLTSNTTSKPPDDILNQSQSLHLQSLGSRSGASILQAVVLLTSLIAAGMILLVLSPPV